MKKLLLFTITILACITADAQRIALYGGAGIFTNTGLKGDGLSKSRVNTVKLGSEAGLTLTFKRWEAGVGLQRFDLRHTVVFDFERDILPDNSTHGYGIAMGPVYYPHLFGNYSISLGGPNYAFAGLRAGMMFSDLEPEPTTPQQQTRIQSAFNIPIHNKFVYGLQAGFISHVTKLVSAGATLSWQQVNMSEGLTYRTYYASTYMGKPYTEYTIINKQLNYRINMYSVILNLRFTLFNKAERATEAEKPEIE